MATLSESSFWDTRYNRPDYLYGIHPNTFLAEHWGLLKGPILSLSEGEGRNGVFLASRGLEVVGVDLSAVALEKAQKLAKSQNVTLTTVVADLAISEPKTAFYGGVVSISAHLPSEIRHRLYPLVEQSLKPNGILILEAYSENQLTRDSGGPKDLDMLMTLEKVRREFPHLEPLLLREVERDVSEGEGHTGMAFVIQFIGQKPMR